MRSIVFVNKEWIGKHWIIPCFKYFLTFVVMAVLCMFFFIYRKITMIYVVVLGCNSIIVPLLNRELHQRILIDVEEKLEQTENGICIHIPRINRGNSLTDYMEQIVWDRERVQLVLFHTYSNIVDIVGHPVLHIIQKGKESVSDTYKMQPEEYVTFHIQCTEENRDGIIELLQEALHREVDREAN